MSSPRPVFTCLFSLCLLLCLIAPTPTLGAQADDEADSPAPAIPPEPPLIREGVTHAIAISGGFLLAGAGVGAIFASGDSGIGMDPWPALSGIGGFTAIGAAVGALIALIPEQRSPLKQRISSPLLKVGYGLGSASTLDETDASTLSLGWAPRVRMGDLFWIRPAGKITLPLGNNIAIDPRPQGGATTAEQVGGFPVALTERGLKFQQNLEMALLLPYPTKVKKPAHLGSVELRLRPELQVRRNCVSPGTDDELCIEHIALPISFGLRWNIAYRQRITIYFGPRIDWLGYGAGGEAIQQSSKPNDVHVYGEAWWELDIPFTPGEHRKWDWTGRVAIGYVHSNLDGHGFNSGANVGFLGPIHLGADVRFGPRSSPWGGQFGLDLTLGDGMGITVSVGLDAPDHKLGGKKETAP